MKSWGIGLAIENATQFQACREARTYHVRARSHPSIRCDRAALPAPFAAPATYGAAQLLAAGAFAPTWTMLLYNPFELHSHQSHLGTLATTHVRPRCDAC